MRTSFFVCQACAFATVCLWSGAYVFTKMALEHFSPGSLGLLRCLVASVCLAVVVVAKGLPLPDRKSLLLFLASGTSGFTLYIVAFTIGSSLLNATTSCILISTSPIITALLASVVFKETMTTGQWLATGLAFCGVLLMALWEGQFTLSAGLIWMLSAALLISIYNLLQRHLSTRHSPLQITAYSFFPGTLLLLVFLPEAVEQAQTAPPIQLLLVGFLGIFSSAVAYLFWGKALSLAVNTSSVTNYMFLTPFLTLSLEYVLTGKLPPEGTFAGGAVILLGLILFSFGKR